MSCIVEGCTNEAHHNLGIRLRRPDTTAIWAPNMDAFLCNQHATQGLKINIILEPTDTGEIETLVSAPLPVKRTTQIVHGA